MSNKEKDERGEIERHLSWLFASILLRQQNGGLENQVPTSFPCLWDPLGHHLPSGHDHVSWSLCLRPKVPCDQPNHQEDPHDHDHFPRHVLHWHACGQCAHFSFRNAQWMDMLLALLHSKWASRWLPTADHSDLHAKVKTSCSINIMSTYRPN